jgi:hypothetical protein
MRTAAQDVIQQLKLQGFGQLNSSQSPGDKRRALTSNVKLNSV